MTLMGTSVKYITRDGKEKRDAVVMKHLPAKDKTELVDCTSRKHVKVSLPCCLCSDHEDKRVCLSCHLFQVIDVLLSVYSLLHHLQTHCVQFATSYVISRRHFMFGLPCHYAVMAQ